MKKMLFLFGFNFIHCLVFVIFIFQTLFKVINPETLTDTILFLFCLSLVGIGYLLFYVFTLYKLRKWNVVKEIVSEFKIIFKEF